MPKEFCIRNFRERNTNNCFIEEKIANLEAAKIKLYLELEEYNSTCNHDLIVRFGKCGPFEPDTGYAVCVCCGHSFHLKLEEHEDKINPDNVLDLTERVSDRYFFTMCRGENVLISRIKSNLLIQDNEKIPLEPLKEMLIKDLIEYSNLKMEENLKRARKKDNK